MNLKLGYYPLLDMALAIRQICSGERFLPYNSNMQGVFDQMAAADRNAIDKVGKYCREWLIIIEKLIDVTLNETSSVEEYLLELRKKPGKLFRMEGLDKNEAGMLFIKLWENHFCMETAKNYKVVYEKASEISREIDIKGCMPYILGVSDRVEKVADEVIKFMIKPEHQVNIADIRNIIVMPSIFASRSLTFWYNGSDYLFYISINSVSREILEPSDMILLKAMSINDKTRLKMLRMLSSANYSTGDLAEQLGVNSSTISRHFKLFKDAGFVDIFSQDGNSIYYSINLPEIRKSFEQIYNYIAKGE